MNEKKVREEYLEFPWGIADTIKNLRALKSILQQQVKEEDCDGRGARDALEVGFDFDRAIESLEKQLPKKPDIMDYVLGDINFKCPTCKSEYICEKGYEHFYCPNCGQKIKWSE